MRNWEKVKKDKDNLCPKCGSQLEVLTDGQIYYKERCIKGCYVFNFETMKREK